MTVTPGPPSGPSPAIPTPPAGPPTLATLDTRLQMVERLLSRLSQDDFERLIRVITGAAPS